MILQPIKVTGLGKASSNMLDKIPPYEIWSHGCEHVDFGVADCDATYSSGWSGLPTLRRNVIPLSSWHRLLPNNCYYFFCRNSRSRHINTNKFCGHNAKGKCVFYVGTINYYHLSFTLGLSLPQKCIILRDMAHWFVQIFILSEASCCREKFKNYRQHHPFLRRQDN